MCHCKSLPFSDSDRSQHVLCQNDLDFLKVIFFLLFTFTWIVTFSQTWERKLLSSPLMWSGGVMSLTEFSLLAIVTSPVMS